MRGKGREEYRERRFEWGKSHRNHRVLMLVGELCGKITLDKMVLGDGSTLRGTARRALGWAGLGIHVVGDNDVSCHDDGKK